MASNYGPMDCPFLPPGCFVRSFITTVLEVKESVTSYSYRASIEGGSCVSVHLFLGLELYLHNSIFNPMDILRADQ